MTGHGGSRPVLGGFMLTLATLSCDGGPAAPDLEPCSGPVTISVSSGTTPRITWAPACTMIALLVEDGAADSWMIMATSDAGFGPGVRYAVVPSGATENIASTTLVSGVEYDVTLFRGTLAAPVIGTFAAFTP